MQTVSTADSLLCLWHNKKEQTFSGPTGTNFVPVGPEKKKTKSLLCTFCSGGLLHYVSILAPESKRLPRKLPELGKVLCFMQPLLSRREHTE